MTTENSSVRGSLGNSPSLPIVDVSELKRLRAFRGLPPKVLEPLEGKVRRAHIKAKETILDLPLRNELFSNFYFITRGQTQILGLDEEARNKPLNFLRKGDFFVDKSFTWRSQVATKAVAITDVEILVVPREDLRDVLKRHPRFEDEIKKVSDRIDFRNRTYSEDKYARSVLEFLIEKDLTQASRVKITQLDKCIECNICYKECEKRHGFQRLERGYARFGTLDFAKSCLTCFYPTCIPACPVDAITFNNERGEVEVLDSCIGCQACERACQYGAIRIEKVVAGDPRFDRFLKADKKVTPKFIADKCNHCYGHEDMACISNCPTGAILEVEAQDLLENPRIFGAGAAGSQKGLPSRIERGFLDMALQRSYVVLGILITAWLFWETYAMDSLPALSPLKKLQAAGWISQNATLEFRKGSSFCNWLGFVGFALMFVGLSYPMRKAFPKLFKYLGRQPAWLDLHNFCGILGMVLVFFHTGFDFPLLNPSTFAFIALAFLTFTGIFGRFLYQVIPRGVAGGELKMRDIEEEDVAISKKLDALLENGAEAQETLNRLISSLTQGSQQEMGFRALFRSVFRSWYLLWTLRFRMPKGIRLRQRQVGMFFALLKEKVRLRRNVAFLSLTSRFFIFWRQLHRAIAYIMLILAVVHILIHVFLNPNL